MARSHSATQTTAGSSSVTVSDKLPTENDLIEFLVAAADSGGLQPGEVWRDDLYAQLSTHKPMTQGQFKYLLDVQKRAGKIVARRVNNHAAYRMTGK